MADKPKSLISKITSSSKSSIKVEKLFSDNPLPENYIETTSSIPKETEIIKIQEEVRPQSTTIGITEEPPQNIAKLHIYPEGKDRYIIKAFNGLCGNIETQPRERPLISLGELVNPKKPTLPKEIQKLMNMFSFQNTEIRQWIKLLISKFDKDWYLVIHDYTNYEIPWEMLELSPKQLPYKEYIGALVTTVRWRSVISAIEDKRVNLQYTPYQCCGKTIAYFLNEGELQATSDELVTFRNVETTIYLNEIREFHNHLQQEDIGYSFVYISCHGTFIRDQSDNRVLGSAINQNQQLSYDELNDSCLNLVQKSQAIIFINACHSAREEVHPLIRNDYPIGFVQIFLEQGAQGVIGTLGRVGDSYAADFAGELIKECLQPSPLPVAEILRELRLKAVKSLGTNPNITELLTLIYRFMYVYYGNPMTVLRLTSSGE